MPGIIVNNSEMKKATPPKEGTSSELKLLWLRDSGEVYFKESFLIIGRIINVNKVNPKNDINKYIATSNPINIQCEIN